MDADDMKGVFSAGRIFSGIGKQFDMYGNSVTLTINNQDSSKSTVGTILSLCTLAVCFGLSWQSFWDVTQQTNPRVKYSYKPEGKAFNVNFSSLFVALTTFYSKDVSTYVTSTEFNDHQSLANMNEYYGECRTCKRPNFNLPECQLLFDPDDIKDLTKMRAINISGIFNKSSYCLPPDFNTTLLDEDNLSSTFSSLSIRIPDNFLNAKKYGK